MKTRTFNTANGNKAIVSETNQTQDGSTEFYLSHSGIPWGTFESFAAVVRFTKESLNDGILAGHVCDDCKFYLTTKSLPQGGWWKWTEAIKDGAAGLGNVKVSENVSSVSSERGGCSCCGGFADFGNRYEIERI